MFKKTFKAHCLLCKMTIKPKLPAGERRSDHAAVQIAGRQEQILPEAVENGVDV